MLLLFNPQKSYRHPALRESAEACAVYDDQAILDCKSTKIKWNNALLK